MSLSPLDLLDDDPLGLFEDSKPKKRRSRKARQKHTSIYDGLDDLKENLDNVSVGEHNTSNIFLKGNRKTPSVKSVTFNDDLEINIPNSIETENCDSNYPGCQPQDCQTSFQSLTQNTNLNDRLRSRSPEDSPRTPNIPDGNKIEKHDVSSFFESLYEDQKFSDVEDKDHATAMSGIKWGNNQKDILSPREKKETNKTDISESVLYYEEKENSISEQESVNNGYINRNSEPQDHFTTGDAVSADEGDKSPRSKRCTNDTSNGRPPGKPVPRKKRTNSARGDVSSVTVKMNDTNLLDSQQRSSRRSDSGTRDMAIVPRRGISSASTLYRPRSCQLSDIHHTGSEDLPNSGDFRDEAEVDIDANADATTLRAMVYKKWYRRHLHSSQMHRINSLKQDALDTRKQRENMGKEKSNDHAFEAWRAQKRAYFREQIRQKRKQEEERQRKLQESNERKLSSSKAFEVWKSQKDSVLKKQFRESLNKEKTVQETKAQMEAEKRAQSEQAFIAWKARKEALAREELQNRKQKQCEEEKRRYEEAREKSEKAAEAYYQWELRKVPSTNDLRHSTSRESISDRFPWRPPSAHASMVR
ncbi:hypothetical protein D915_007345 [Fasciola hepatica]|uniref:Microtubule-associated protein 9 n=1 Tax=Fasciola hepatica TaxID=6192 RepID=A0A4E0R7N4_FASHE|nr:hypothetical protein D915_007345 [Fasciola hepatica]